MLSCVTVLFVIPYNILFIFQNLQAFGDPITTTMNRERRVSESTEIVTRDGSSSPGSLMSTVSSELNGIAAQTSSMFSGFFSMFPFSKLY